MNQAIIYQITHLRQFILQHVDSNPQSPIINLLNNIQDTFLLSLHLCKNYKLNGICNNNKCIYRHTIIKNKIICRNGNNCIDNQNNKCEYSHINTYNYLKNNHNTNYNNNNNNSNYNNNN